MQITDNVLKKMYGYYSKGLYGEALRVLAESEEETGSPIRYLIAGLCHEARRSYDGALESLKRWHFAHADVALSASAMETTFGCSSEILARGTVLLGSKFIELGEHERGETMLLDYLESCLVDGPAEQRGIALKSLGMSYLSRGAFQQAVEALTEAIPFVRGNGYDTSDLYEALARSYRELGSAEQSIQMIEKGISIQGQGETRVALYLMAAELYYTRENVEEGRCYLEELVTFISSGDTIVPAVLLVDAANMGVKLGSWETVGACASKALESREQSARDEALVLLARSQYETQQYESAMRTCDQILDVSGAQAHQMEAAKLKMMSHYAGGGEHLARCVSEAQLQAVLNSDLEFRKWFESLGGSARSRGLRKLFRL